MKKIVGIDELNELTESQKDALRMLWKPEKYNIVVVPVCFDVENEIYDYEVYIIKDIMVNSINDDKKHTVSKSPVHSYDYYEMFFKVIPLRQSENRYVVEDDYLEEMTRDIDEVEDEVEENIILINREDCIPLLDISMMLEILYQENCKFGMRLELIPNDKLCSIEVDGKCFESSCLCDLLWEVIKKVL